MRPRLVDQIDPRYELMKLVGIIDWEVFEREWSGFFPSHPGWRRGCCICNMPIGCQMRRWSAASIENPSYQHFTGEVFFQHRPPIDPTSLTRLRPDWRKGLEWLLMQTTRAGQS